MADLLKLEGLPIWLINLPSSRKRRESMELQLNSLALEYRPFAAVNGSENWVNLETSIDISAFERNVGCRVLPGEIGCYHSHLGVWKQLVESDAPAGLVLEDDVIFHENFKDAVNTALKAIDQWDILKLNFVRAQVPIVKADLAGWRLMAYLGPFTGTGAYLITRGAAEKLLDRFLPITRPIDHEIDRSHVHGIKHLGMVPFPSHVKDDEDSTITGKHYASVAKFPPYARLGTYRLRYLNLFGKSVHTLWRYPQKRMDL